MVSNVLTGFNVEDGMPVRYAVLFSGPGLEYTFYKRETNVKMCWYYKVNFCYLEHKYIINLPHPLRNIKRYLASSYTSRKLCFRDQTIAELVLENNRHSSYKWDSHLSSPPPCSN